MRRRGGIKPKYKISKRTLGEGFVKFGELPELKSRLTPEEMRMSHEELINKERESAGKQIDTKALHIVSEMIPTTSKYNCVLEPILRGQKLLRGQGYREMKQLIQDGLITQSLHLTELGKKIAELGPPPKGYLTKGTVFETLLDIDEMQKNRGEVRWKTTANSKLIPTLDRQNNIILVPRYKLATSLSQGTIDVDGAIVKTRIVKKPDRQNSSTQNEIIWIRGKKRESIRDFDVPFDLSAVDKKRLFEIKNFRRSGAQSYPEKERLKRELRRIGFPREVARKIDSPMHAKLLWTAWSKRIGGGVSIVQEVTGSHNRISSLRSLENKGLIIRRPPKVTLHDDATMQYLRGLREIASEEAMKRYLEKKA